MENNEMTEKTEEKEVVSKNFIEQEIDKDLAEGVYDTVHTRFPPEPNGYLHIGHAKSILLNYGLAQEYGGKFNMRFDDTNPTKEKSEFVESIKADIKWLGADWEDRLFFASDYFDQMYEGAVKLIKKGKAYVSDLSADEIRAYRGTLTEPGKKDPYSDRSIEENLELLEEERDEEMRELLKEDLAEAKKQMPELEKELKLLLLPKDPNDEKNVFVEIRAGAGGDEAALFAADLFRMYSRFAERNRWKSELISVNESGIGGMKEVVFMISGQGAYSRLKYESGVHRVQRVPETESGGRIHTSTATVAIMPEAEDVDVVIDMNDCKFDVFRASGNGGQCVNTTDSAVRLTHIPTGIVISCQDEKSQLKNKDKALKVLRAKLFELETAKKQDEQAKYRRSQIGTGDRSEKIRTYNFPQSRVTDHRIKLTLYKLDAIMDGDLFELIDSLTAADQAEKLSNMENQTM